MGETSFSNKESNRKILKQISKAIDMMSRYTFWESQCLVRAIAGNEDVGKTSY